MDLIEKLLRRGLAIGSMSFTAQNREFEVEIATEHGLSETGSGETLADAIIDAMIVLAMDADELVKEKQL